jgi:hypothetical protein
MNSINIKLGVIIVLSIGAICFLFGYLAPQNQKYIEYNENSNAKHVDSILHYMLENAYFEGQRDAINKDVRIEKGTDSSYYWIKSPWDNGRRPVFIPTIKDNKKY